MSKTFATLFSGCGGSDTGLSKAGFEATYAIEWNKGALDILVANHDVPIALNRDINNVDYTCLPEVDLLWASPVCCNFSNANPSKGETDLDIKSSASIAMAAQFSQSVIIENVPAYYKSVAFRLLLHSLDKQGLHYHNTYQVNASDYGNPSSRLRTYGLFSRKPFIVELPQKHSVSWDRVLLDYQEYWVESELTERQKVTLGNFLMSDHDDYIKSRPVAIERVGYYNKIPKYHTVVSGYPCIKSHSHHTGQRDCKPGYGKIGNYRSYMDFWYQGKAYSITPQLLGVLNGFSVHYYWGDNKAQATAAIGNAVVPKMAEILGRAFL